MTLPRKTPLPRSASPKRKSAVPMRKTAIRKRRPTLRRGEPTPEEKEAARVTCFTRAHGRCQIPFPHECPGYVPLKGDEWTRGQLAHLKAKRRFGWFESEETGQRWIWACRNGHDLQHKFGWSGIKPCPAKAKVLDGKEDSRDDR